jgi:hypothetical protein
MFKSILAGTAAVGLLVAPIAAQANTRAVDSAVSLAPIASSDRIASPVGASEQLWEGFPEWLLVLLFALIAAGIIIVIEQSEDDASPGTGA